MWLIHNDPHIVNSTVVSVCFLYPSKHQCDQQEKNDIVFKPEGETKGVRIMG